MKIFGNPKYLFIGVTPVLAYQMTKQEYCDYRGWSVPKKEDPDELGFFVEYMEGGEPNHKDHVGYITWSPKGVFDCAYRANGSLRFGDAIELLKAGKRVARTGWNGKGMWLSVSNLDTAIVPADKFWSTNNSEYAKNNGGHAEVPPCITMKNAKGQIQMGWVASQEDMFAEDWEVVGSVANA